MRILREEAAALLIDVQERLFPHMQAREELERSLLTLIRGLGILEVPLLVTQQYTRGLGETIPSLREVLGWQAAEPSPHLEKRAFSCCDEPDFAAALAGLGRRRVIVAGIEAHVCVLQTVVDLLAGGYTPVVAADCVSSRRAADRDTALRRMEAEGALLTTCESILFELTRSSAAQTFRAISQLVK